jgi:putative ABC transport system permease protein
VFGVVPAFAASRLDLNNTLKDSGRAMGIGRGRRRFVQSLVIGEISISMVLLVGAGLLAKSFLQILNTDVGFNPRHVLKMGIDLSRQRYPDAHRKLAFYQDLLQRVQSIPGVLSAGLIDQALPIGNATDRGSILTIPGPASSEGHEPRAMIFSVDANYFRTMQIPLAAGREFNLSDTADALPVAVVSRSVAHRYFSNENPIGRQLRAGPAESQDPLLTIVGVVGDVRHPLVLGPQLTIYHLYLQNQNPTGDLVIRTALDPISVIPQLRREIRALDSNIPDIGVASMEESLSDAVSQPRFSMALLAFFAGLALLLVAVGVYGVTHYWVAQRVHEIGVRMALGAQKTDILKLIIGFGLRLAAIGVAIGVAAALGLTRLIQNQLFGVSATDPATFVILSVFLIFVSLSANFIPARRATQVDPLVALRGE